jgi:hypothetical protein
MGILSSKIGSWSLASLVIIVLYIILIVKIITDRVNKIVESIIGKHV